ncbi:MAG TPA: hypothetical protein VH062_24500 [Polyangiaceae bacterium]|jgi:hypothetical protein|nr:hypothetical protein [Polyangiaceae bacterium]
MLRARIAPIVGRSLRSLAVASLLVAARAVAGPDAEGAPGTSPPSDGAPSPALPSPGATTAPSTPEVDAAAAAPEPPPRFDARTHFSLSWVRLPGAEECVSAKQLSRDVERRLSRPALGAPAETDVAIEGFIEKTPQGTFHAVVTIADARGKLLGKRELERPECSDIDAALGLAVALMIDPDAAFSPTARPVARAQVVPPAPVARPRVAPRPVRGLVSAGVGLGFGALPRTSQEAWMLASVEPVIPLRFELGAHLSLDQTVGVGQDVGVAFSRSTLDAAVCPADAHVSVLRLGACAGVEAGVLSAAGDGRTGLISERSAVVDGALRGHVDVVFLRHFSLRIIPGLGIPFIRNSFDYRRNDDTLAHVYRLPAVRGDVGVGVGVELP